MRIFILLLITCYLSLQTASVAAMVGGHCGDEKHVPAAMAHGDHHHGDELPSVDLPDCGDCENGQSLSCGDCCPAAALAAPLAVVPESPHTIEIIFLQQPVDIALQTLYRPPRA